MCVCCASFVLNLVYFRFVLNFYFGCARSSNLVAFSFFICFFHFLSLFLFSLSFLFTLFFLRCPFLLAFTTFFQGGGGLFSSFICVFFFVCVD